MRQIIPENIKKLADMQMPYAEYKKGVGVVMRSDTPPEVLKAREEYLSWMRTHSSRE